MKKITQLLLILLLFSVANAQKVYFIYIQSENDQPFYARMGEKIYNSSATGYLILSKLKDSSYLMNIGVQGSQSPEQLFSLSINNKDKGYLLKNFGEKGWGLFDFQSLVVVMPAPIAQVSSVKTEKRETNAFTDLLAKAADDSTLKEKPVEEKVEKPKTGEPFQLQEKKEEKGEVKIPAAKNEELKKVQQDTIAVKAEEIKKAEIAGEKKEEHKTEIIQAQKVKPEEKTVNPPLQNLATKTEEIVKSGPYKKSNVIKRSESSTTEGFGLIFLDIYSDGKTDTVRILIPEEKKNTVGPEFKKEEKKFLDIVIQDTVQEKALVEKNEKEMDRSVKTDTAGKAGSKNSTCLQTATEEDFFNLRKKMAGENGNDNMIYEAKKIFSLKCFTTEQIRNLGVLFLSDEGKYKFYDASYEFVSDSKNFSLLQSELKDEYYINRFKTMLRN